MSEAADAFLAWLWTRAELDQAGASYLNSDGQPGVPRMVWRFTKPQPELEARIAEVFRSPHRRLAWACEFGRREGPGRDSVLVPELITGTTEDGRVTVARDKLALVESDPAFRDLAEADLLSAVAELGESSRDVR